MKRARVLLLLAMWWALFRWPPVDEPPGYVLMGPYQTVEECEGSARALRVVFPFEFVRCILLDVEVD